MIDVQAADAPGLFAAPSGVSLRAPARRARRDAHGRAERRGRRRRHLVGERARASRRPPRSSCPPAARRAWRSRSPAARRARSATARATSCSRPGRTPCTSAGGATSSARTSPRLHSRHLAAGRWIKGDTREGTRLVKHYRWPAGPGRQRPAARSIPGREQLWSFIVPPGARNAGVEAEGSVVPQILLARDENRLGGRARAARERQSVPRDLRPLRARQRAARAGAGPLLRRRRDAAGPQAGPLPPAPLDQRPHAARDHAGPARRRALRRTC